VSSGRHERGAAAMEAGRISNPLLSPQRRLDARTHGVELESKGGVALVAAHLLVVVVGMVLDVRLASRALMPGAHAAEAEEAAAAHVRLEPLHEEAVLIRLQARVRPTPRTAAPRAAYARAVAVVVGA